MKTKFSNPYINELQEDTDVSQENIAESPPNSASTAFNIDGMVTSPSTSSSSAKRRLVSTPATHTHTSNYISLIEN